MKPKVWNPIINPSLHGALFYLLGMCVCDCLSILLSPFQLKIMLNLFLFLSKHVELTLTMPFFHTHTFTFTLLYSLFLFFFCSFFSCVFHGVSSVLLHFKLILLCCCCSSLGDLHSHARHCRICKMTRRLSCTLVSRSHMMKF